MASTEIRERRRTLRYRNLLVRQAVQMKNKIAVLLMEAGVSYNKQKLHKVGYFRELLATNQDIDAIEEEPPPRGTSVDSNGTTTPFSSDSISFRGVALCTYFHFESSPYL
jgi:hypothetical protein